MNAKTIIEGHTQFGPYWIDQQQDILQLRFDELAIQSEINSAQPYQLRMHNLRYLMGILLFTKPPEKILLLGVGGGSLIQFARHYLPHAHITGIEYDAELLQIAQSHLLLPQADSLLDYQISDARVYIDHCRDCFDLIIVDIFDAGLTPDWLLQSDYIKKMKGLLTARGAITYNLLINSEKEYNHFYQQLRNHFERRTLQMETEDYENIMLYAFKQKIKRKSMLDYLQLGMQMYQQYQLPFNEILGVIYNQNPTDSGVI